MCQSTSQVHPWVTAAPLTGTKETAVVNRRKATIPGLDRGMKKEGKAIRPWEAGNLMPEIHPRASPITGQGIYTCITGLCDSET